MQPMLLPMSALHWELERLLLYVKARRSPWLLGVCFVIGRGMFREL